MNAKQNTKYAKKTPNTQKKTPNTPKNTPNTPIKHQLHQICKEPNIPKYSKFSFTLFCRQKNFLPNSRTFWCTFYRPKNMVVYQKRTNIRYGPSVVDQQKVDWLTAENVIFYIPFIFYISANIYKLCNTFFSEFLVSLSLSLYL